MARFVFTGRDENGKRTSGTIEATNQATALKMLADTKLTVTKITEAKVEGAGILRWLGLGRLRIRGDLLLFFTTELAALLKSGVSMKTAMGIVLEDCESPMLRQIVVEIESGIAAGTPLSELLGKYPGVFSKLYLTMVAAGESEGKLPSSLTRLAAYIEYAENAKSKLKAALYYPAFVLVFAMALMAFVLVYGIPRVEEIYADLGSALPLPTQLLINFSHALSRHWIALLGFLILMTGALVTALRMPKGRLFWDGLKLRLPVVGSLFRRLAVARFARILGSLYGSGVPILESMQLVSGAVGNKVIENAVLNAAASLREGDSIVGPLRRSKVFTGMSLGMIATGEEAGTLDQMLEELADFYDAQVDASIKGISSLLEPVVLVGMGVFIGGIVFSLGLPFLSLANALQQAR